MTSFEKWQVIVSIVQAGVLLMTFLGAIYIGFKQNEINDRLRALQDYVAISAVPSNGIIKLLNTGKTNLYLWGFDMPNNNQKLDKSRLISAGTNDSSYYWIPSINLNQVQQLPYQFEFKLYLKDEFDQKWISEHGGEAYKDGADIKIRVWSYKTYKSDWDL